MKRNSKFLCLFLMLAIVFSSFSFAFADEEQIVPQESPSSWAIEYLMEAQIQKLADEGYFARFKQGVTRVELADRKSVV